MNQGLSESLACIFIIKADNVKNGQTREVFFFETSQTQRPILKSVFVSNGGP